MKMKYLQMANEQILALLMRLLCVAALLLPAFGTQAGVVLTSLHSFQVSTNGANPYAGLVQGSDGYFYGTTAGGGTGTKAGTVFKISTNGALTNLYLFTGGDDGASPDAGLVQGRDGSFYGTTSGGGTNGGNGTVFKISTNGALTSLYSFTGTNDGANPQAGLVQGSDGNFYGTTVNGGTNGYGTVFKISTNGTLTSLYSFTNGNDGAGPYAGLVQGSDGNFYGTTAYGGTNGYGAVFKISTNGTLTSLHSFTGGNDGAGPYAGLVQGSDGNFYGTTSGGNTNTFFYTYGTVFQISTNGALTTLYSFTGQPGASPQAGLVQGSDGNFYGTTYYSGPSLLNGNGTVFQISTNGALTNLYSFTGNNDGAGPNGLVQGNDGNFYGTTYRGGTNNIGTVFQISTNGALTSLYSFPRANDGATPQAGLVQGNGGNFYGTTYKGGTNNAGTVFQISTNGALTSLYSFTGTNDGANPHAGLVQGSDGNFYGTTVAGGSSPPFPSGTVFKISPNGTLTNLHSFDIQDGANPQAGLVQGSDGYLYGTTEYGGQGFLQMGYGTVFEISTNGALTRSYALSGYAYPYAGLVQGSDGNFYGTTFGGGTSGYGTVFQVTTNGSLTRLHSFTGTNDGANPYAGLVQGSDGNFYGTTYGGGTNGFGNVFQISTNGALTNLYSFTGTNDGAFPVAGLVQGSDGYFYGTTAGGDTGTKAGTVFKISTNGALTSLYSFTGGNDGAAPVAGLVQGRDGSFYGTTSAGGVGGAGTVFRLTIQPQLSMTVSGANVILSWPTNYAGWYLQKTVNLGAAGFVRITLQGPPVIVNGQFVVTLPITDPQQGYYRLSSQ